MYLKGEGVAQDAAPHSTGFKKAAEQGHTGARIELGYMYAKGVGTPKEAQPAYAWITSASLSGDARGRDLLPSLEAVLTPQQVLTARERARDLQFEGGQQFSATALAQ